MSTKYDLLIVSAGKLGREMLCWVHDSIQGGAPWKFKGFLDDRQNALSEYGYDEPIIGEVEGYQPGPNDRFLCAIGDVDSRRSYTQALRARGGRLATLIHPTVLVSRRSMVAEGAALAPFVSLGAEVTIGDSTFIGSHSNISHDGRLGSFCELSGHACLGGNVTIEDSAFVGLGAVVVPGVTIGSRGFVGAGSVVLQDVPAATKVFGNPAVAYGKVSAT